MNLVALTPQQQRLAEQNRGLVFTAAQQYCSRNHYPQRFEEFVAEGMLALCEAAGRFDPDQGAKASTWIYAKVLWRMRELVRSADALGMGRGQGSGGKRIADVTALENELSGRLGRPATDEEIAARSRGKYSAQSVGRARVKRNLLATVSLDIPASERGDDTILERELSVPGFEGELVQDLAAWELWEALRRDPRMQALDLQVFTRHAIEGEFVKDIAGSLGVSESRIWQRIDRARKRAACIAQSLGAAPEWA